MKPLEGVTVVALEQAVAAPLASRQLADLGARVIKIERVGQGDFAREYDASVKGLSSHFVWLNRSKESLSLDVKHPQGMKILRSLLTKADVFIQNLSPTAIQRLDLGSERLAEDYPRLVVCNISGYGTTGPYRDKKAYDLLIQAETGLLSISGTEGTPAKAGVAVADIAAGMYAFSAVLTALFQRERTGKGAVVGTSLFDALSEWMGYPAYYTLYGGSQPLRTGVHHATIAPYGPFCSSDGRNVYIAVQNNEEWTSFCRAIERPHLTHDPRFSSNSLRVENREELNRLINASLAEGSITASELLQRLDTAKIAYAEMRDMHSFLEHPQLVSRNRFREVMSAAGPLRTMLPAIDIDAFEAVMGPIPEVGQHSDTVLAELGYQPAEIAQLRDAGVI